jgi:ubiquinone/menaquinone biosynthesis C-methylase UbiE
MRDYKAASRNYFDRLAPHYDHHYYGTHGRQQYQRVVDVTRVWKFTSVLDVGCGTGGLLASLKRPKLKLAGADLSLGMIEEAKKRLGKTADLRVADSEALP